MADKKIADQYYTPPPKLTGWESFKLFLWNGETSQFLGRTAGSWGEFHFAREEEEEARESNRFGQRMEATLNTCNPHPLNSNCSVI